MLLVFYGIRPHRRVNEYAGCARHGETRPVAWQLKQPPCQRPEQRESANCERPRHAPGRIAAPMWSDLLHGDAASQRTRPPCARLAPPPAGASRHSRMRSRRDLPMGIVLQRTASGPVRVVNGYSQTYPQVVPTRENKRTSTVVSHPYPHTYHMFVTDSPDTRSSGSSN